MLWLNISKSGDILHETSLDKIVIHLLQNTLVHCKAHFTFLGKQLEEKKNLINCKQRRRGLFIQYYVGHHLRLFLGANFKLQTV